MSHTWNLGAKPTLNSIPRAHVKLASQGLGQNQSFAPDRWGRERPGRSSLVFIVVTANMAFMVGSGLRLSCIRGRVVVGPSAPGASLSVFRMIPWNQSTLKGRTGFCEPNTTFGIQDTSCNAAAADRRKMNVGYAEVLTKLARFVLFGYNKFQ